MLIDDYGECKSVKIRKSKFFVGSKVVDDVNSF